VDHEHVVANAPAGTSLLKLHGVGIAVAATLLGQPQPASRFFEAPARGELHATV
jgi:hypothetical protein